MKKIINYGFIFCLSVAVFFGFATPKSSKATIVQPEYNNNVDYSKTDYTQSISDYSLFNNYDYSYLNTIDVGIHLKSSNVISTNLTPTQATIYTENCFGNLCYSQDVYIAYTNVYFGIQGTTTTIYAYQYGSFNSKTLTYSNETCNTTTYVNRTIGTSQAIVYFVFTNQNNLLNFKSVFDLAYDRQEDSVIATGSTIANARNQLQSIFNCKILYVDNTGLDNISTQKVSTCNTGGSYSCNNVSTQFDLFFYGIYVGNITLSKNAIYDDIQNICTLTSIGTSISNGYYNQYNIDFKNLSQNTKKNIWQTLTQQNQTNTFTEKTFNIQSSNSLIRGGLNIDLYLQLNFKGNINYQYNNLYIKFDSNTLNTLEYIYYGIFDLNLNYSTNNTYANYLLNESSVIQSEFMTLLSTLQTNGSINYYLDYNFNLALISDVVIDQILSTFDYDDCRWYQFMCHLKNGFNKLLLDMPILSDFNTIFDSIVSMAKATFDLFEEYKEITFLGTICIVGLLFHFIKRSTE